jgi:ParB family chromosome partitioning protein
MNETISRSYQLLTPLDRAVYFQSLLHSGKTKTEIALLVGKSLPYVSNSLRLLELPEIVKDGLESNLISEGHARALLGLKNTSSLAEVYTEIIRSDKSVRETEALVREKNAAQ